MQMKQTKQVVFITTAVLCLLSQSVPEKTRTPELQSLLLAFLRSASDETESPGQSSLDGVPGDALTTEELNTEPEDTPTRDGEPRKTQENTTEGRITQLAEMATVFNLNVWSGMISLLDTHFRKEMDMILRESELQEETQQLLQSKEEWRHTSRRDREHDLTERKESLDGMARNLTLAYEDLMVKQAETEEEKTNLDRIAYNLEVASQELMKNQNQFAIHKTELGKVEDDMVVFYDELMRMESQLLQQKKDLRIELAQKDTEWGARSRALTEREAGVEALREELLAEKAQSTLDLQGLATRKLELDEAIKRCSEKEEALCLLEGQLNARGEVDKQDSLTRLRQQQGAQQKEAEARSMVFQQFVEQSQVRE